MKYGIIKKGSYYVEGDERSRTHPGHGYPGGTEYYTYLQEFPTEDDLQSYLQRWDLKHGERVIRYEEVTVSKEVKFSVA